MVGRHEDHKDHEDPMDHEDHADPEPMDGHAAAPEPLYRLPSYSHADAQGIWLTAFAAGLLDLAAAGLLGGALLARRWHQLPPLGTPWLRCSAYPAWRLLVPAAMATVALAALAGGAARALLAGRGRSGAAASRLPASARALALVAPLALPALLAAWAAAWTPLYPPLAFLRWSARYQAVPGLAADLGAARAAAGGALAALLGVTLGGAFARLGRLQETGDTHGSAHWATPREVATSGLLHGAGRHASERGRRSRGPEGSAGAATRAGPAAPAARGAVVVGAWWGRAPGERRARLHRLYDRRDRHVLAYAPPGSGKTTCLVVPTLLAWPHSAVVLDVKGELWHLTAGYRRRVLGQSCLRLDLGCADGSAARYNPLLLVPRGPEDVKQAQSVADTLVDPDGRDRPRSFWDQSAHALLTAAVLHVLYGERDKSLAGCARLLSDPARALPDTLDHLLTARHDPRGERGFRDPASGAPTATHPLVAATARTLLDLDPRTTSGIVATAGAHLALFRDPVLAGNTAVSDFSPLDLVAGERPVTLYLTLAPADLDRLRGPVRLLLNQLCRALTQRMDFAAGSSLPAGRHPLLLMLDEFAVLGRLDFFGRAMAYLRGYGVRVYLSLQSLAQLHEIYGPHQSITATCPVQVAFAPADLETAEHLSRMTGAATVHVAKRALANAPLAWGPRRHTLSLHEVGRPLLTAEEVRRLPESEALVFAAGHAPIRARRAPYWRDAEMVRRCRLAAPERSDRIAQGDGGWGAGAGVGPERWAEAGVEGGVDREENAADGKGGREARRMGTGEMGEIGEMGEARLPRAGGGGREEEEGGQEIEEPLLR
jgi:type IV secretion system protein VirD4